MDESRLYEQKTNAIIGLAKQYYSALIVYPKLKAEERIKKETGHKVGYYSHEKAVEEKKIIEELKENGEFEFFVKLINDAISLLGDKDLETFIFDISTQIYTMKEEIKNAPEERVWITTERDDRKCSGKHALEIHRSALEIKYGSDLWTLEFLIALAKKELEERSSNVK